MINKLTKLKIKSKKSYVSTLLILLAVIIFYAAVVFSLIEAKWSTNKMIELMLNSYMEKISIILNLSNEPHIQASISALDFGDNLLFHLGRSVEHGTPLQFTSKVAPRCEQMSESHNYNLTIRHSYFFRDSLYLATNTINNWQVCAELAPYVGHGTFIANFLMNFFISMVLVITVLLVYWMLYCVMKLDIATLTNIVRATLHGENPSENTNSLLHDFEELFSKIHLLSGLTNQLRQQTSLHNTELMEAEKSKGMLWNLANEARMKQSELRALCDELSIVKTSLADKYEYCNSEIDRLAKLNRRKSEFLAGISHEIRTPLNAVIGFSEILRSGRHIENARRDEYINYIYDSGHYMLSLIREILDFAKAEYGTIALDESDVELAPLINECINMLSTNSSTALIPIRCNLSDIEIISVDPTRIKQVLNNLLTNAIKFSMPGDYVDITSRIIESRIEIAVADMGVGIPGEDIPRVLELFGQLKTNKSDEGVGVGLALSKKIVELHGGALKIYSSTQSGTSVVVELPIARLRRKATVV